MLTNLFAYLIVFSFGYRDVPNNDTTVIGKALNAKAGAIVNSGDTAIYYVDGLMAWDKKFYGKEVKVTGKIVTKNHTKDVNDRGESVQTIVGIQRIIVKPKWSLVK